MLVWHTGEVIEGELGDFLRSRRERLTPSVVGLPPGTRRRTPGLRRAEVATLAGISVEYLTRIEQGRDTSPSIQVLSALASTLQLNEADRAHLQQLANISHGTSLCARELDPSARTIRPAVRAILESLDPTPAYVINRRTDLLAWNNSYDEVARPLGMLEGDPPNMVWFTFTHPQAHDTYPDWNHVALQQVSYMHAQRHGDPATSDLVDRLAGASPAFSDLWSDRPLTDTRTGLSAIDHPDVGLLRLTTEALALPDRDPQHIIVNLPADTATAAGLERLAGRTPGRLRAVAP